MAEAHMLVVVIFGKTKKYGKYSAIRGQNGHDLRIYDSKSYRPNLRAPDKPEIILGKPALILAPMEGVTDAPMRAFLSERGGFSFCVSEFLRVSQDALSRKVFYREIPELHDLCSHSVRTSGSDSVTRR